jgi:tRNA pseudouridine38-40 synthase
MRYKLTIAYDGTAYSGWQVQPNGRAIQTLIQRALETVLRAPTDLTGSGRTDAGVHARGQTAHFDTAQEIEPHRLRLSLNALLPYDIRILQIDRSAPDFHARYDATSKIYHYHLHLDPVIDPFVRLYRHQVLQRFDLERVQEAIPHFLGTKDFCSFSNVPSKPRASIKTLLRLDIALQKGGIRLEFEGDGFLYKMVRNIVGALLDVGSGKLKAEEIPKIFSANDRRAASSAAAPPQGLFLMEVRY